MAESAIKSDEREAARLFERGVGAARGGQRRVAAGLLGRAVQLNPRHEMGWLWLSGVLEDPNEIAFCLRSALAINPDNQRARQGLAWLEQRGQISARRAPAPAPIALARDEEHAARAARESWWIRWRHEHREMSRARLVFWTVPILLLLLTLGLNLALRDAVDHNTALAQEAARPKPTATARATPTPILQAEPPTTRDAAALAYISVLEAPRARLRAAIESYRDSTSQPGGSSIAHAAAARKLRETLDATYQQLTSIAPPATLAPAHNSYLAGLEIERRALDDMLEFYSSFHIQFVNRATLRMVDAERQFDRARALVGARQATMSRPVPQQTLR